MPKCFEKGMLNLLRDVHHVIMSSCLSSSTTAWDSGVHQLLCHGVTVRSRPPGSYDQGGIGGPDWLVSHGQIDPSSDFVGKMEGPFSQSSAYPKDVPGRSPSEPVELHWSIDRFLCQSLTSLECRRPVTPSKIGEWEKVTFVPDDVEWKMCIISNPW